MWALSRLGGTTALVTGASGGIGLAFATELARRGADLVLVARSTTKLDAVASSLSSRYGIRADVETLDLSHPNASQYLFERVTERGIEVHFLVNNAGGGGGGEVSKSDPADIAAMMNLNALAAIGNTVRFLPGMVARGRGVIVNVSSLSAFQPMPYLAAYAASKAMLQSFTLAVGAEVADAGVRVLVLAPGVTLTGQKSEDVLPALGGLRTPDQVVATAFRALATRKSSAVDGRRNTLLARTVRLLPERTVLALGRRLTQPGLANESRSSTGRQTPDMAFPADRQALNERIMCPT